MIERCLGCGAESHELFCDACYHSLPLYMRRGLQAAYSVSDMGAYMWWTNEAVNLLEHRKKLV